MGDGVVGDRCSTVVSEGEIYNKEGDQSEDTQQVNMFDFALGSRVKNDDCKLERIC